MVNLTEITAAMLAGGLGTRLRSTVVGRPKALALINGRPFLSYLLDQLAGAGLKEVVLCVGYLGEQIKAEYGSAYRGLSLSYSQEALPLGTAGALRLALPFFQSETVLILNGDSFCETNLPAFAAWHFTQPAAGTLLLTYVADTSRYGSVQIDSQGRIVNFSEKSEAGGPGWINAGIYLLRRSLVETIPAERAVSIEEEMFPTWLEWGLYGYQGGGSFLDIGTPESYTQAEQFFTPIT
jgi:NDP-sugar pyrophosphorylase family protein